MDISISSIKACFDNYSKGLMEDNHLELMCRAIEEYITDVGCSADSQFYNGAFVILLQVANAAFTNMKLIVQIGKLLATMMSRLRTADNESSFELFYSISRALESCCKILRNFGKGSLAGCVFHESTDDSSLSVTINLGSTSQLTGFIFLWCHIQLHLIGKSDKMLSCLVSCLSSITASLTLLEAPVVLVIVCCNMLRCQLTREYGDESRPRYSVASLEPVVLMAIHDVVEWLNVVIGRICDPNESNSSQFYSSVGSVAGEIYLLISDVLRSNNGRSPNSLVRSVSGEIIMVLQSISKYGAALSGNKQSSNVDGNQDSIGDGDEATAVVARLLCSIFSPCMQSLCCCVELEASVCPSFSFLFNCLSCTGVPCPSATVGVDQMRLYVACHSIISRCIRHASCVENRREDSSCSSSPVRSVVLQADQHCLGKAYFSSWLVWSCLSYRSVSCVKRLQRKRKGGDNLPGEDSQPGLLDVHEKFDKPDPRVSAVKRVRIEQGWLFADSTLHNDDPNNLRACSSDRMQIFSWLESISANGLCERYSPSKPSGEVLKELFACFLAFQDDPISDFIAQRDKASLIQQCCCCEEILLVCCGFQVSVSSRLLEIYLALIRALLSSCNAGYNGDSVIAFSSLCRVMSHLNSRVHDTLDDLTEPKQLHSPESVMAFIMDNIFGNTEAFHRHLHKDSEFWTSSRIPSSYYSDLSKLLSCTSSLNMLNVVCSNFECHEGVDKTMDHVVQCGVLVLYLQCLPSGYGLVEFPWMEQFSGLIQAQQLTAACFGIKHLHYILTSCVANVNSSFSDRLLSNMLLKCEILVQSVASSKDTDSASSYLLVDMIKLLVVCGQTVVRSRLQTVTKSFCSSVVLPLSKNGVNAEADVWFKTIVHSILKKSDIVSSRPETYDISSRSQTCESNDVLDSLTTSFHRMWLWLYRILSKRELDSASNMVLMTELLRLLILLSSFGHLSLLSPVVVTSLSKLLNEVRGTCHDLVFRKSLPSDGTTGADTGELPAKPQAPLAVQSELLKICLLESNFNVSRLNLLNSETDLLSENVFLQLRTAFGTLSASADCEAGDAGTMSYNMMHVLIHGTAQFVELACVSGDKAALQALAHITDVFSASDCSGAIYYLCWEALSSLSRVAVALNPTSEASTNILQYLLFTHPLLSVQLIIIPLLRNIVDDDDPPIVFDGDSKNPPTIAVRSTVNNNSKSDAFQEFLGFLGIDLETFLSTFGMFIISEIILSSDYRCYLAYCAVCTHTADSRQLSYLSSVSSSATQLTATAEELDETVSGKKKERKSGIIMIYSALDECPLVLYRLLTCAVVQRMKEKDLVGGGLRDLLLHLSRNLGLRITNHILKGKDDSSYFPVGGTLQRVLLLLLWDLGGEYEVLDVSWRALGVICPLMLANDWTIRTKHYKKQNLASSEVVDDIANVIGDNFLYFMSNLFQKEWQLPSVGKKVHSLRVLIHIVSKLRPDDVIKFLPKIMFAVDTALSSQSAQVRYASIILTNLLIERLPLNVLKQNIVPLVIGLYPILQNSCSSLSKTPVNTLGNKHALLTVDMYPSCDRDSAFGYDSSSKKEIVNQLEIIYEKELDSIYEKKSQLMAETTMIELFVKREVEVGIPCLCLLPYVPRIPPLLDIYKKHVEQQKSVSFKDILRSMCDHLHHESTQVRIVALKQLEFVWSKHRKEIYELIERGDLSSENKVSSQSSSSIVSHVLNQLLSLCAKESSVAVRASLALTLGEIGAVDPNRITFLPLNMTAKQSIKSGLLSKDSNEKSSISICCPWNISPEDFGFMLLESHLVPSLRALDSGSMTSKAAMQNLVRVQDRTGFAIQSILKAVLVDNSTRSPDSGIPDDLKHKLMQKGILVAAEPFWNTKYSLTDSKIVNDITTSKCFGSTIVSTYASSLSKDGFIFLSFEQWIGAWCPYLISFTKGPFNVYFRACMGAARTRPELGQFLLPYILLDIVCYSSDEVAKNIFHNEIVIELRRILEGGGYGRSVADKSTAAVAEFTKKQLNQRSIQAIFALLDTLEIWGSLASAKLKEIDPGPADPFFMFWKDSNASISRLLNDVPKSVLGQSALSINAFARALLYFETEARDNHRKERLRSGGKNKSVDKHTSSNEPFCNRRFKSDTNGELPILPSDSLDQLMMIYSNLEEHSDALQGVRVLRQICGYSLSPWHRILELEHTAQWLDALLEYGMIINGSNGSDSLDMSVDVYAPSTTPGVSSSGKKMVGIVGGTGSTATSVSSSVVDLRTTASGGGLTEQPVFDEQFLYTEKGRMRCLVELGQLDAVIDQTYGILHREHPSVEAALLPLGVEAAWKLQQWDDLSTFLTRSDEVLSVDEKASTMTTRSSCSAALLRLHDREDKFQISLGKLLSALQSKKIDSFQDILSQTRLQTMSSLSAASMESYTRSYPLLTRLHVLKELEHGYFLVNGVALKSHTDSLSDHEALELCGQDIRGQSSNLRKEEMIQSMWDWKNRLKMMVPSTQPRALILAVRRIILGLANLPLAVAENWFECSTSLRQCGQVDGARIALRNAENFGLSKERTLVHESNLLKDNGQIAKGLVLLEPMELDIAAIRDLLRPRSSRAHHHPDVLPEELRTSERRSQFAARLLLATKWMVESRQQHGRPILERFKLTTQLRPEWDEAYFHHAHYVEYLYQDANAKELELYQSALNTYNRACGRYAMVGVGKNKLLKANTPAPPPPPDTDIHEVSSQYMLLALSLYSSCIEYGTKFLMQAQPRMLTAWLTFTAQQDMVAPNRNSGYSGNSKGLTRMRSITSPDKQAPPTQLQSAIKKANTRMGKVANVVSAATWYACIPQLVSRTGHSNPKTVEVLVQILIRIVTSFPQQSIWHLSGLSHSLDDARQQVGRRILLESQNILLNSSHITNGGETAAHLANRNLAAMLKESYGLFQNLVELARFIPPADKEKSKQLRYSVGDGVRLSQFLVPTQSAMNIVFPDGELAASPSPVSSYFPNGQVYIHHFEELIDVANSKARPKTITIATTCGKTIKFLCKQEKNGDLRKDARLMEFNTVLNSIFRHEAESRRRNMRLRTFAVICINEECGILEWVNNTNCLRHLIAEAHSYWPELYPMINNKETVQNFQLMQQTFATDIEGLVKSYKANVLSQYRPCFHRWFIEKYPDPTDWLEARTLFTRSVGVWSAVGHIVGLGDRHTENILVDLTNGECVHVDFDCLFDKGLTLSRPEIVPFRLSLNMIDAMGLTGKEGTFRRTMEVCIGVLRDNKEMLLSVLEPFIRDPTVAWGRVGRAQQRSASTSATSFSTATVAPTINHENADAKLALAKISERLNGVYNIIHPNQDEIVLAYYSRKAIAPSRGIGALKEEALPLSVPGQVQRLIDEATAEANLAQMYVGWQPWM